MLLRPLPQRYLPQRYLPQRNLPQRASGCKRLRDKKTTRCNILDDVLYD
jgi:hypothetical protein